MFDRDPIVPLNSILMPAVRYLGTNENILSLEALKNVYQLIASNLEQAKKNRDTKVPVPDRKLSEGDSILLKITLQVCEALAVPETMELHPFLERLKLK